MFAAAAAAVRRLGRAFPLVAVAATLALVGAASTVAARSIAGKRVLLLDDLIRSGATLSAVARALGEAGAETVFAFALTTTRRV